MSSKFKHEPIGMHQLWEDEDGVVELGINVAPPWPPTLKAPTLCIQGPFSGAPTAVNVPLVISSLQN